MSPLVPNAPQSVNHSAKIPENFDDFLGVFHAKVASMEGQFRMFLSVPSPVKYQVSDGQSFAFSPADRMIHIPQQWLMDFHANLLKNNGQAVHGFAYTWNDLFFGLFHELSHFRDLLMESKKTGRASMKAFLESLHTTALNYGVDKKVPIGSHLHTLFNCIDDIIVNKEVEMFSGSDISAEHLQGFYKYNLFADRIPDPINGDYDKNLIFVGKGNGSFRINDTKEVDYSNTSFSRALPYFLLRAAMVKDQDISLPKVVSDILFADDTRARKNPWKTSVARTAKLLDDAYEATQASSDTKIQARAAALKGEYILMREQLQNMSTDATILGLLSLAIDQTGTKKSYISANISLIDCIALFCASHGREGSEHILDITPALRYKIYSTLFLPIQKACIIMDLFKQDLPDPTVGNGGGKSGEGNGEPDNGKSDTKTSDDAEKDASDPSRDKNPKTSGESVHKSPDIQDKIDFLDDVDEAEDAQQSKELVRKLAEKKNYDVSSILESSGVGKNGKEITNNILTKEGAMIESLVQFFLEQIQTLDKRELVTLDARKKGRLNTGRVRDYIAQNPEATDIHTKSLYDKSNVTEALADTYRKMDICFAIDISGSMDMYKSNGMVHIIPTVLFIAMKHLEAHLRDWLEDPDYTIPINFILYGEGAPYSSFTSPFSGDIDSIRMADLNEEIHTLTGGTNDVTAWANIAQQYDQKLTTDLVYAKEIKDGARCPVILQIADNDVTENGVDILQDMLNKRLGQEVATKNVSIKRIVLGNVSLNTLTREEYEARKMRGDIGNWDPIFLPNGTVQLKEISVKSRKEILAKIKELFTGFLAASFVSATK